MKKIFFLFSILICFPTFAISDSIFLSLKKNKVNVRYGPGFDYEVKYIYKKKNFPVKILDKKENWRKIIDIKKNGGWIHWSQLKKINSFITTNEKILFLKPSLFSKPIAKIQEGRLLLVDRCITNWCKIKTEEYSGWINSANLWGKIP
tara:strand:+ start:287 stop:730 length:444 start_codon:yes stop_codon:yes gene_type:complete